MKILKCSYPKGYYNTNIYFNNTKNADEYIKSRKNKYSNLSKRRKIKLNLLEPRRFRLTQKGNKFLLWERMN